MTTALPPSPIPATFTPTATASPTPTETPLPTATSTSVIGLGGGAGEVGEEPPLDSPTTDPNATPTNTRVLQTATLTLTPESTATPTLPPEVIPDSGAVLPVDSENFLLWVGGGLLFVVVIYGVFSRFKLFSQGSGK